MIYVDSNIFISSFLTDDKKSDTCKSIISKIVNNEVTAFTSVLTWYELVWVARKHLGKQDSIGEGKKFLEFPSLRILDVDELIIRMAQDLMESYNLKPRDAIHAATAISHGVKQLISDDPDFDAVKEIKRVPIEKFK